MARNGVHNVKTMPRAEMAIMTVFNQRKNRVIQMDNQQQLYEREEKEKQDIIDLKKKQDEMMEIKA